MVEPAISPMGCVVTTVVTHTPSSPEAQQITFPYSTCGGSFCKFNTKTQIKKRVKAFELTMKWTQWQLLLLLQWLLNHSPSLIYRAPQGACSQADDKCQ